MTSLTLERSPVTSSPGNSCPSCEWAPPAGEFWPSEGRTAIRWIQKNLICAEGDFYGKPLVLRQDQKFLLMRWYEFCGACGHWRFTEGLRGAARGDGKTTLIAAIACLEFAGPPQIAPYSPNVVITATSWEQADILFSAAATMLGGRDQAVKEAPLCGFFEVYDAEVKFSDGRPGRLFRTAAVAASNEGGQPTLFIADEVHELGDVGERKARVHTVLQFSTTKRRLSCRVPRKYGGFDEIPRGSGRTLSLSTAGFDVEHSLLGAMYLRGQRAARDPGSDPRYLMDWHEADAALDPSDPEHRAIGCRQASQAADVIFDVATRVRMWDDPKIPHNEWLRYFWNLWIDVAEDSWLKDHPGAWKACQGAWTLTGDEATVLAVDMALKRDSVSVGECMRLGDGRTAFTAKVWYPGDGKIDHLAVFDWIRARALELGDRFRGLVYDPRFFELPARQLEEEDQLLVIEFDQSPSRMVPACGMTFDAIVAGQVVHDGDPDVARQVKAAVRREAERGWTLSKGRSRIHIDAAITLCMGFAALAQLEERPDPMKMFW